jgi:hypothetical protein
MKSFVTLLGVSLLFFCLPELSAQDSYKTYKYSKIYLSNGKIVNKKDITLKEDHVAFSEFDNTKNKMVFSRYYYSEIEKINIAKKSNALPGFLIGTLTGFSIMLAVESNYEEVQNDGGFYVQPIMTIGPKIAIVAGGALLGTFIGASIRKGWETVYTKSTSMNGNLNLNFALDPQIGYYPKLNISYKF